MRNDRDIIAELSGDLGSVGYRDLRVAVALVSEWDINGVEQLKMGEIAQSVAMQTQRKAKTVSKSLARITIVIWESGDKGIWKELYNGHLPAFRPTPKNFIIRLAYFERQCKRLTGGLEMYRYEVSTTKTLLASHSQYGILAKEMQNGKWVTVAVAAPFSGDREAVAKLADTCSTLQLSPIHLVDVVSDFIFQNSLATT